MNKAKEIRELLENIEVSLETLSVNDKLINGVIEARGYLSIALALLEDEPCPTNWLHKECEQYVPGSGKCMLKVPTRYNDFCEPDDCPKINCQQKPEQRSESKLKEECRLFLNSYATFIGTKHILPFEATKRFIYSIRDRLEAAYKKIERLEAHIAGNPEEKKDGTTD